MTRFFLLFVLALLLLSCRQSNNESGTAAPQKVMQPHYVGRDACKECHAKEYDLFLGSDHDMAMDIATDSTVLGDFNNSTFTHLGVKSRFYRHNGEFFVHTEGEGGVASEFKVKFVFGFRPLQQYVVEFPNGRYQMLPLCWDTRPESEGGQHWFHIYGQERIAPADILYWTRMVQNWNYMCSECHSTNVRKNYDDRIKSYATSWSEVDVSCEACHGPGSAHVDWAKAAERGQKMTVNGYLGLMVRLKNRDNATWVLRDVKKGTAERTSPVRDRTLVDMCGRCHSRRSILSENYVHGKSLLDTHHPVYLQENLYFADGQIQDEVYVYGSFLQSKMYSAGVVCSDCHEPHSGKVFVHGNALCYRCHAPEKFGVRQHHFHDPQKSGGLCLDCHMPERTYMVIDPRRDHSMRVPRPDLSDKLETPNACTKCHSEKSNRWAADYTIKWYGEKNDLHYGQVFYLARKRDPSVLRALIRLAMEENAPMIRATALSLLQGYPPEEWREVMQEAISDPDPLIRTAATMAASVLPADERSRILSGALADSVLLVRTQAAVALAGAPTKLLTRAEKSMLKKALAEYESTQLINADHQTAWLNLALLALGRNDLQQAKDYYKKAIEIEPLFPYSYINLADMYRLQGREDEGEKILLRALQNNPDMAAVHHALGLLYVRQKRMQKAMRHLELAASSNPENARFAYVYGIALNSAGETERAITTLETALRRHPYDLDLLTGIVALHRDNGNNEAALAHAQTLTRAWPQNKNFWTLKQQLQQHSRQ